MGFANDGTCELATMAFRAVSMERVHDKVSKKVGAAWVYANAAVSLLFGTFDAKILTIF